ncbi:MAG: integral rane sensor hybrid histidine kinase [Polaromonas sp.]|nr:integral rane sensor hybrid histidine kinase [Polaromonas sp.]
MAAAFILPVVMAAGIALDKIMEGERKAALRGLSETVRATALIVDREVQGSLSGLKALGTSPHLETGNFEAFYGQAKAQDVPPDVWTLLLDSSGTQLLNTAVPFGTPPPPAVSLERVKKVIATQKPLITDVFTGPVTGKKLITIYLPAAASGGKSLVVAQAFSVDHWKKTALQHPLPADWVVAVIDKTGKFISRSHRADELLGQPARPELVSAAAAQDGLIRHTTLEGVDSYDAFAHSALTGWTIAVAAPVTSIEAAAQRAVQVALIGILLAVAAAVVAIAVFGRRLMEAFESAQVAAIELGQGRKPVVLASSIHEVNAFNFALADAGTLLELERTARQVAEQEKLNLLQAATQARQAAEAQNIAKDKFLAMLGHELRNPLAAISGAIALLEIPGADSRRLVRCTGIISRQNRHLRHIVDDLLDVSRLLAGKIELVKAPLDLAECVNNCVEALRTTEGDQKTRIVVRADSVWVNGDGVRLEQILNNLLGNALKFSMPGGANQCAG